MATRKEKIGFTISGIILGAVFNTLRKNNQASVAGDVYTFQDGLSDAMIGGALGGVTGRLGAEVFGSPNDTVNYQLFDGKKHVYDGIAYEDRIDGRIREHKALGKEFTRFKFDRAKPRSESLELEKKRIKLHRSKYNIQHNSNR